jgi:endonuclease YncB( thermonuclease family)
MTATGQKRPTLRRGERGCKLCNLNSSRIGLIAASFAAALLTNVGHAGNLSGEVVGVTDGDTVTVLDREKRQIKVRLVGIDAPEKRQPFGQKSKASLSELTYRRMVIVITDKTDRYGRTVGKVVADGQDVNLEQVRRGMAWHYKAYSREQSAIDRVTYAAAEDTARSVKRGLWSMPGAQPPWEFRRHGSAEHVAPGK